MRFRSFALCLVTLTWWGSASVSQAVDQLACIRHYESGGNYRAASRYQDYGAYQFKQTTWDSAGGKDYDGVRPDKAPPRIQDKRASRLIRIRTDKGLEPLGKWSQIVRRKCR